MLDIVLHAGTEHPNMLWIVAPAIFSFMAGLAVGIYRNRIADFISTDRTESPK